MDATTWHNITTLHPMAVGLTLLLGMAMLMLPRRYAFAPIIIMACFVSPAQRVVVATLDFNLLRILVLFGWARLLMWHEMREFRWKPIDSVFVAWVLSGAFMLIFRHGDLSTVINRAGHVFDAVGMYFLFRMLIRDWKDIQAIAAITALVAIPVAAVFLIEQSTGRNMFAIFGGVPEYTVLRDGRLRCRGPFSHPIVAGCFWATMMPLMTTLWWRRDRVKYLAPVGVLAALIVVFTTASSTPVSAVVAGCVGAALFPLRRHLSWLRWGAVVGLVMLQFVMVNPIWHLVARVELVGGSTGWYRYKLVDGFIRHTQDWWLVGTDSFSSWWNDRYDVITNQYILEGVNGGLLALMLFILVIFFAFRAVGGALRQSAGNRARTIMVWALGVTLLIHTVDFLGVSYFGQIVMAWHLILAIVASIAPHRGARSRKVYRVVGIQRLCSTLTGDPSAALDGLASARSAPPAKGVGG